MEILVKLIAAESKNPITDLGTYVNKIYENMRDNGLIHTLCVNPMEVSSTVEAIKLEDEELGIYSLSFTSKDSGKTDTWKIQFCFGTYKEKQQMTVAIYSDTYEPMSIDELVEALYVEGGNHIKVGRNEFGAGLKTAAGWFGEKWSVSTVQYGSGKRYIAVVDKENLENEVPIYEENVEKKLHGTVIKIEKITKKLTGPKTIAKIKDLLASMYRRDINSGNVDLRYNGDSITFEGYPILSSFRGRDWKKEIDYTFNFNEKNYHVTGFVAIMDPGSFPKAGFALFRRDRVIIGGSGMNYKPNEIFGQDQSQISLKLFGELNMDDFPVNQAKDGFVWDDGLEEEFISTLKSNIQEYIKIADISKKDRTREEMYSKDSSTRVQDEVNKNVTFIEVPKTTSEERHENDSNDPEEIKEEEQVTLDEFLEDFHERNDSDEEKIVGSTRYYNIPLNEVRTLSLEVDWSIHHNKYWINVEQVSQDLIKLTVNIDHPFFRPYSNQEDFKIVLEKFVISFVVAEVMAKMTSDQEGYIYYKAIRDKMNEYLKKMGEE